MREDSGDDEDVDDGDDDCWSSSLVSNWYCCLIVSGSLKGLVATTAEKC